MLASKRVRIPLLDIIMGVICIFPITTPLIQEDAVLNKIIFTFTFAVLLLRLFTSPMRRSTLFWLLVITVHYVFVIANTVFPMENINLLVYFPFFLLYTYFVRDHAGAILNWFARHKRYLLLVLLLWTGIIGVSAFLPSCYYLGEGNAYYFGSFCGTIFRLGPAAVFIQILALVYQRCFKRSAVIALHILPMYCYFMGSSRAYMVVGLCIFLVSWYYFCKRRLFFWVSVIPLTAVAVLLLMVGSIGDKILYTLDESHYGDFWFRITSSRSLLWANLLKSWKAENLLNKCFGAGLNYSYSVINRWAHNDFFEILCSFGVFGVMQYCLGMWSLLKRRGSAKKMPWVVAVLVFSAWFFNACTNMHYTYICAMLSYPFMVFIARYDPNDSKNLEKCEKG